MIERLQYAVIGAVIGVFVAVTFWWLHGLDWNPRFGHGGIQPDLIPWIKASSATCGLIGFLLKDKVGSVAGGIIDTLFRAEQQDDFEFLGLTIPRWLVALVLLVAIGIGIYLGLGSN